MSHDLKIETGRRNGTPVQLWLCSCNDNVIQDESHVHLDSSLYRDCRGSYNTLDFSILCTSMERGEVIDLCGYIHDGLKVYYLLILEGKWCLIFCVVCFE